MFFLYKSKYSPNKPPGRFRSIGELFSKGSSSVGGGAEGGDPPVPGPFQFTPQAGERNAIVWDGLSYVYGDQGFPELSTAQPFNNVEARNGTSRVSSTAGLYDLISEESREQLYVGSTNQLAHAWTPVQDWIVHDQAIGGSEIGDHVSGSTSYGNHVARVNDVITLISPDTLIYRAICFHGFGFIEEVFNGVAWATFEPLLLDLYSDYLRDIQLRTGQDFDFPLIMHQAGYWAWDATPLTSSYANGQLALALTASHVFAHGPSYQYDVGSDNTHLTNNAYLAYAESWGNVLNQIFQHGNHWRPLHALTASANGNDVIINYFVPSLMFGSGTGLTLDTGSYNWREAVANTGTHGFRYIPNVGVNRSVLSVSVTDNDEITITLDGAPEVGGQIGYADVGARPPAGPTGNLRDGWSGSVESGVASHLYNWASTQRITIT